MIFRQISGGARHLIILLILALMLVGCSSSTLLDAIKKSGHENVKILIQDESDKVVLFLSEDGTGQPMLVLNSFSKNGSAYHYDSGTGEYGQSIDVSNKYEIVTFSKVGNYSFGAVWGGVFNYPNATTVTYSLKDQHGDVIHQSNIKITDSNIVYEKISQDILKKIDSFQYKILDHNGDMIIEH